MKLIQKKYQETSENSHLNFIKGTAVQRLDKNTRLNGV